MTSLSDWQKHRSQGAWISHGGFFVSAGGLPQLWQLQDVCPTGLPRGQVTSELCCNPFLSQSTPLFPQLLGSLMLPGLEVPNYICDLCCCVKLN